MKGKFFSAYDKQCGRHLNTGRNSKTELECVNDVIEFLFSEPREDGDPTPEEAVKWPMEEKLSFINCAELEIYSHEDRVGE